MKKQQYPPQSHRQPYAAPLTELIAANSEYQLCAGSPDTGTGSGPKDGTIEQGGGHRGGGAKSFWLTDSLWTE